MIEDNDDALNDEEFPDDFDLHGDEDDEDDEDDTQRCGECGAAVYEGSTHCPKCGHWFNAEESARPEERGSSFRVIWTIAAALVIASMLWWLVWLLTK